MRGNKITLCVSLSNTIRNKFALPRERRAPQNAIRGMARRADSLRSPEGVRGALGEIITIFRQFCKYNIHALASFRPKAISNQRKMPD